MKLYQIMVGPGLALLIACPWQDRQPGRLVGAALAQTPADHPASFTGSLTSRPASLPLSARQTVYVPAYSSIRLGSGKGKVDLATTLSIHNTSEETALVILRADYFDTSGALIHSYVRDPIAVRPLGTVEAFVPAEDTRGGSGANFLVEWAADGPITEPLIEAVIVGNSGTQGYSFVSRGKVANMLQPAR
jgi:hypothetical protein